ncbi:hypothetical protein T03_16380, partial [Trichinella britovi]
ASSEHLPQCVLDRPDKPLPVSAAPRSSFSGVSPLIAPAGQLVLKLFSALADEKRADERICLLECSEGNAERKLVVVMSATISMCTARVTMQVKRQM